VVQPTKDHIQAVGSRSQICLGGWLMQRRLEVRIS
jgi:hypothetical protein